MMEDIRPILEREGNYKEKSEALIRLGDDFKLKAMIDHFKLKSLIPKNEKEYEEGLKKTHASFIELSLQKYEGYPEIIKMIKDVEKNVLERPGAYQEKNEALLKLNNDIQDVQLATAVRVYLGELSEDLQIFSTVGELDKFKRDIDELPNNNQEKSLYKKFIQAYLEKYGSNEVLKRMMEDIRPILEREGNYKEKSEALIRLGDDFKLKAMIDHFKLKSLIPKNEKEYEEGLKKTHASFIELSLQKYEGYPEIIKMIEDVEKNVLERPGAYQEKNEALLKLNNDIQDVQLATLPNYFVEVQAELSSGNVDPEDLKKIQDSHKKYIDASFQKYKGNKEITGMIEAARIKLLESGNDQEKNAALIRLDKEVKLKSRPILDWLGAGAVGAVAGFFASFLALPSYIAAGVKNGNGFLEALGGGFVGLFGGIVAWLHGMVMGTGRGAAAGWNSGLDGVKEQVKKDIDGNYDMGGIYGRPIPPPLPPKDEYTAKRLSDAKAKLEQEINAQRDKKEVHENSASNSDKTVIFHDESNPKATKPNPKDEKDVDKTKEEGPHHP